jgi:hypothetical protein
VVATLLAVAACGRIGFDASAGDGGSDGSGSALVPLALPEGGQLRQVVVAPSDNSWYVHSVGGRLFRNLTGEPAFHPCGDVPGSGVISGVSLVVDTVYATGTATFASSDHCASWTAVPVGRFTYGMADVGGTPVALTDIDLRKDMGGATWAMIAGAPAGVYRTFSSRGGPAPVYLFGTQAGPGVVATPDGVTFSSTLTNLVSKDTTGVAVGSSKTYAITQTNTMGESDIVVGNATGTAFTENYTVGGSAIAVDPGDPDHAIAAVYDNLAETFDGFATAPQLGLRTSTNLPDAIIYGITFTQDRQVLIANNRGLYRSAPGGLAFAADYSGISAWEANAIVRDGTDVLIPTDGGLLVSRNGAAFDIHEEGTLINTAFSAVHALPNGELWGTGRGVWRSTDRGLSWTHPLLFDVTDDYYGLSITARDTTIYVGTHDAIRVASPPYTTWATQMLPVGTRSVQALYVVGDDVWAGTPSDGAFVSRSDGAFVAVAGTTGAIRAFAALPTGVLLVGTSQGLFASDAARTAFTAVASETHSVRSIEIDGSDILLGTTDGIVVSRDGGATWIDVIETAGANAYGAVLDQGDRSIIYSDYGRGIARAQLP